MKEVVAFATTSFVREKVEAVANATAFYIWGFDRCKW